MKTEWVIVNRRTKTYLLSIFPTKESAMERVKALNDIQDANKEEKIFGVVPKTRFYDEQQTR